MAVYRAADVTHPASILVHSHQLKGFLGAILGHVCTQMLTFTQTGREYDIKDIIWWFRGCKRVWSVRYQSMMVMSKSGRWWQNESPEIDWAYVTQ